jgi:hypothetical protein
MHLAHCLFLIGLAVVSCSCTPPHPSITCIDGVYRLNGDEDVRLYIFKNRFELKFANSAVTGVVRYDSRSSEFEFDPQQGRISQTDMSLIDRKMRRLGNVRPFLDAMSAGAPGSSFTSYQNDRVVIEMDYKSIFFWKAGCKS